MPTKTFTDQRVLDVMEFVVANSIKDIEDEKAFLISIEYDNPNNITLIKQGTQSFRVKHLQNVCKKYNIDGNYLLNRNHKKMSMTGGKIDVIKNLKEAVKMVDELVKGGKQR